ncbi:MAG: ABC transporter ATP-binding protein [Bradymonadia bacterium]
MAAPGRRAGRRRAQSGGSGHRQSLRHWDQRQLLRPSTSTVIRDLLHPHRRALVWMAMALLGVALTTGAYGILIGPMLRSLFGGADVGWPGWLGDLLPPLPSGPGLTRVIPILIMGVATIKGASTYLYTVGQARIGQRIICALRERIHQRLMEMPPDAVSRWGVGDLMSRASADVVAIEALIFQGYGRLVGDGAQVIILVVACVASEPSLAVVAFAVYPIVIWPMAELGRRLRKAGGDTQVEQGAWLTLLHRQLDRLPLLQLMAEPDHPSKAANARSDALARAVVRIARLKGVSSPLMEVFGAAALAGTIFYAADQIAQGALSPEGVLSFFACLLMLYQPVKGLTRAQAVIAPGQAALERIEALLEMPERLPEGGTRQPQTHIEEIRFEGVCVRRGETSIGPLSCHLRRGEITTWSGANGSGKSTMAWALGALIPIVEGQITVDGEALSVFDAPAWRRQIGWLAQEAGITGGSLRDNITLGRAVTEGELHAAARLADLDALLARLPEGWETELQEGGRRLSGGERQRVALARALLGSPGIIVLDEPDAHLDQVGRRWLMDRLESLCETRIIVLIAHDPEWARHARNVVEFP